MARRSAFVHGYLHGYEEGFHQADFDLQMGRVARGESSRDATPFGYKRDFGSKQMFNGGFREGFRVGYADGVSGRNFRAVDTVMAALGASEAPSTTSNGTFDEGVHSGYLAGQHQGLDDARRQVAAEATPVCPVNSGKLQQEFCSAYASGYQMGYADGFTNQAKSTLAEAKQ